MLCSCTHFLCSLFPNCFIFADSPYVPSLGTYTSGVQLLQWCLEVVSVLSCSVPKWSTSAISSAQNQFLIHGWKNGVSPGIQYSPWCVSVLDKVLLFCQGCEYMMSSETEAVKEEEIKEHAWYQQALLLAYFEGLCSTAWKGSSPAKTVVPGTMAWYHLLPG